MIYLKIFLWSVGTTIVSFLAIRFVNGSVPTGEKLASTVIETFAIALVIFYFILGVKKKSS